MKLGEIVIKLQPNTDFPSTTISPDKLASALYRCIGEVLDAYDTPGAQGHPDQGPLEALDERSLSRHDLKMDKFGSCAGIPSQVEGTVFRKARVVL